MLVIKNICLTFLLVIFGYNIYSQDTLKYRFFNVSLNSALIVNNSLSNYSSSETGTTSLSSATISSIPNYPLSFGYSLGASFYFGNKTDIKQIIGINFEQVSSYFHRNYNYQYLQHLSGTTNSENIDIKRTCQFFSLSYGTSFGNKDKLSFSFNLCYNINIRRVDERNGTIINTSYQYYPPSVSTPGYGYFDTIKGFSKNTVYGDINFFSLKLRLAYAFKIKKEKFGVFLQRNFSLKGLYSDNNFFAPWWYVGISYFPIKKREAKIKI